MSIKKDIFAPLALGLGATRRAAMLLLVMMLTTATAWADNINVETAAGFGTLTDGKYTLVNGNTYTLTADVNTNGYIYVPEGVTATIDLAGHTIDRGLTNAITNGMVIWVAGSLTVTDSGTGGTVKGGMDSSAGHVSCVMVYSDNGSPTFTLQGGTLIGNTSYQFNCAVCAPNSSNITISGGKITGDVYGIESSGHVTVTGGEISGNTIGILSLNYSISVSGNPVITNNTSANVQLFPDGASVLTIAGELTDGANIGITKGGARPTDNAPVTVTSGYGTYNSNVSPSTYFSLDNNGQIQTSPTDYMTLVMGWNEDRTEIAVGTALYTVNFEMNGHGDDIDAVSLLSGYKVAEPTEPTADGWYFFGWYTDDVCTSQWNFNNAVTSNMTLHALWAQEAIYSFTLPEKMVIVSTTNAPVGGKYPVGTVIKFKVSSADYVVDGDVSDGTNTLTPDGDGIYTVTMGETDITITATIKKAVEPNKTLSGSENYEAKNSDVLTGSTSGTVTIADGAKITLSDVTITGGIVCAGTAEITLVGTNSVSGATNKAGIQVGGSGTKLTIKGNGSLTANGDDQSAGIGLSRAWKPANDVIGGDIIIEGGNITANGSVNNQWGAGIGTGVIYYGDGSAKTARIGDITIKGGSVKATGGSEANGIGTGYTYYGCTNTIGTVTIYDGIDKVDASSIKDFNNVIYMHGETNVTANKSDYFTITEDGNRRVIELKDDTDYTITIANGIEHGTLTGAATAKYTEKVTITATPDFGYRLSRLVVKDAQNNDVASTGNTFLMPKSNVTVSAVFEQGTHGTTEFAWGYYEDDFVKEATIYDGVTTVNLQQGKEYFIGKDYQEGREPGMGYYKNTFRLDEDPYTEGRNIPYSGGTGSFRMGGRGKFRLNGDAGFYDITMTDVGNGKWNVSILKTAGQMDVVPDQTYTGSEITPEPLVIAGSLSLTKGTDYEYSYTNNTNVGTAKVRATFHGDYASLGYVEKEFTIVKATPTVNAPTAVENLVYKGSAQALVNAGSTDFGTLLYSLDGQNYSADIPTATDAGTYTIYYKVEGSDNWNAVAAQTIQATILPSTVIVNVTGKGTVTYNDKVATNGEVIGVVADKGTDVTLTLAPESGYAVSIAYGYTNNSGTTASGLKLPINGTTATLTVPNDLKDGTYVTMTVSFVSALAGGADEASAVVLTGNTVTNFAGGWYKVDSNITFDHTLNLLGDTHLIIDDGKTMTVNTASSEGILSDYTLFVSGEGTLSVATTDIAVCVGNYVQTGATVTASGSYGIRCTDDFIAFNFTNDFTFSGGQLTATGNSGGIWADNDITLSCTNATDYISANSYSATGTVKIAEDMSLHNGSEVLSGIISDMNKLNGKTLIGVDVLQDKAVNDIDALTGKQTNVTLSDRTLYKDGYWNTLVLPFDVTIASSPLAGDNVVAKVLSTTSKLVNGTLTLNFDNAPATIPAGTPFIIKWDKSDDLVNPVFTGVTIDNTNRDVDFTGGSFKGTYAPLEITDANRSKVLLLSGNNKLGYAKTDRTIANKKALGTCRAYFYFPGSQTARSFVMNFGEDDTQTTGIVHTEITEGLARRPAGESQSTEMAGAIYDLQGRHVEKAKKGLYIVNGKKVVIK